MQEMDSNPFTPSTNALPAPETRSTSDDEISRIPNFYISIFKVK
ncbi:hypothetical protein EPYR_03913 [Erwinia pyrifoliae DSM 12163]|nr:hypothetical protein EPYR_03913 [Erwinia pyrifoliae DSM 12163]